MYSDFINNTDRRYRLLKTISIKQTPYYESKVQPPDLGSIDPLGVLNVDKRKSYKAVNKNVGIPKPVAMISDFKPVEKKSSLVIDKQTSKLENSKDTSNASIKFSIDPLLFTKSFDFDSENEVSNKRIAASCRNTKFHVRNKLDLVFASKQTVNIKNEDYINLNTLVSMQAHFTMIDSQILHQEYKCKYCGQYFIDGCALGGHISKVHRGMKLNIRKRVSKKVKKEEMSK